MSSPAFRTAVKQRLAALWTHCVVIDLSDEAVESIPQTISDPMLLLEFVGGPEQQVTIGNNENHGWREDGRAIFHLVFPLGESSARALAWGEELVFMFRGKRLGDLTIDFMEHFSDFAGAAIRRDGRWHGWSANVAYTSTICA